MPGKNVLVAEDDAVLRKLYEKKFPMHGFEVRTAGDGGEAIKLIEERAPDLLLLDLRMPGVDGLQVLQHFPKAQRSFPIIALTNFYDDASKSRAMELGADAYYTKKDMTMRTLIDEINRILGN